MTPQAVVFDIGNVLIEWQPERFYDSVIGADRRRAMFDAVDLHGMNDRVDSGENFRDTIYAMAEATPDWRDEIRLWHDRWIDMAASRRISAAVPRPFEASSSTPWPLAGWDSTSQFNRYAIGPATSSASFDPRPL